MDDKLLEDIITMTNINFYTRIFSNFEKREASLTYTESMIVNIIDSLEEPTVNKLVGILNVSQPNISYKINTLVSKGYVRKVKSKDDGRKFILKLTERYEAYKETAFAFTDEVMENLKDSLTSEELENIYKSLRLIRDEMKKISG